MSSAHSATQLTKLKSGGLLLLRRRTPLTRRSVAYFHSGAHRTTYSLNFPTLNGYTSTANANGIVFVTKLDPTGSTLLYSTYFGGTGGEYGWAIARGQGGNVYVVGETD